MRLRESIGNGESRDNSRGIYRTANVKYLSSLNIKYVQWFHSSYRTQSSFFSLYHSRISGMVLRLYQLKIGFIVNSHCMVKHDRTIFPRSGWILTMKKVGTIFGNILLPYNGNIMGIWPYWKNIIWFYLSIKYRYILSS